MQWPLTPSTCPDAAQLRAKRRAQVAGLLGLWPFQYLNDDEIFFTKNSNETLEISLYSPSLGK
jgi:hypothetical protein